MKAFLIVCCIDGEIKNPCVVAETTPLTKRRCNAMNKYEVLYIIKNEASEEAKQAIIDKMEAIVVNAGGTVDSIDKWGTKRFAYAIDFKNEGYYVLMNFQSNADVPSEIERQVKILDDAIRCMIIKK